jgi:hypothetical protein
MMSYNLSAFYCNLLNETACHFTILAFCAENVANNSFAVNVHSVSLSVLIFSGPFRLSRVKF